MATTPRPQVTGIRNARKAAEFKDKRTQERKEKHVEEVLDDAELRGLSRILEGRQTGHRRFSIDFEESDD